MEIATCIIGGLSIIISITVIIIMIMDGNMKSLWLRIGIWWYEMKCKHIIKRSIKHSKKIDKRSRAKYPRAYTYQGWEFDKWEAK